MSITQIRNFLKLFPLSLSVFLVSIEAIENRASIERTPEASPVLGLLVLGIGGYVFPKLKNRNNKPKQ